MASDYGNRQQQLDEMSALQSMYEDKKGVFEYGEGTELISGRLRVDLPRLATPLRLNLKTETSEIKKYALNFAAPIDVYFKLPEKYPSFRTPRIKLTALWLTRHLKAKLMRKIIKCCKENIGMGMLFFVMQTIIDETNDMTRFAREIDLNGFNVERSGLTAAKRLELLQKADEEGDTAEFENTNYECEVCFENVLGKDCTRFLPCKHVFCRACATSYFKTNLNDSTVKLLECMQDGCQSIAADVELRKCLTEEELERYQSIVFRNALEAMGDVVICARMSCQLPVIIEQSDPSSSYSTIAQCAECRYAFCLLCRRVNHGIEPCRLNNGLKEVIEQYDNGTEAQQKELEKRYGGQKRFRALASQYKSEQWMLQNSKTCPRCNAGIERSSGCNKMQCTKCNCNFCWLCRGILDPRNPYDHYADGDSNGSCGNRLFEGTEMELDTGSDEEFVDYEFMDSDEEGENFVEFMGGI
ncbi:hypothetical protein QR680_000836 [Steinernema hermaphroditum]|uniref:RBR-type E3 ubiquitin transferase n=1 Tax=Steinernema hermaphroditum TaxID=289476 RepID=A0AA39GW19_9BILA|nr:hypothetical protein QR680_000836 [Steinernema hermaphroditum]